MMTFNLTTGRLLEQALADTLTELREKLGEGNIGSMNLTIEASGRVGEGDLKVEYIFYCDWKDTVRGGTLEAVVTECLRRMGWSQLNAPLCLPRA